MKILFLIQYTIEHQGRVGTPQLVLQLTTAWTVMK
jgi:hypothetical protein